MDKCIAAIEYRKNYVCVSSIALILFFWLKNIQNITKGKAGTDLADPKAGTHQRQLSGTENVPEYAFQSIVAVIPVPVAADFAKAV